MDQGRVKSKAKSDKLKSEELRRAIEKLAATPDLVERRHILRPLPAGEVVERDDPEAWEMFAGTTQSMFVP